MFRALVVFAVLAFSACRKGPREPRFAIEIPPTAGAPSSRVVVDEGLGSDSQIPLAALAPAATSAQTLAGWETLGLHYVEDGSRVNVTVFALHQEYDPRRHATVFRSQKLGAHIAREGESVRLAELAQYGYSPLTLRVVPAK